MKSRHPQTASVRSREAIQIERLSPCQALRYQQASLAYYATMPKSTTKSGHAKAVSQLDVILNHSPSETAWTPETTKQVLNSF